jgi:anti-anti-sigma regulatory factor
MREERRGTLYVPELQGKNMFSVEISDNGNKLVIIFGGLVDLPQAEQFYAKIQEAAPRLKKGFILLTDLSSLERMDVNAKSFIEKVMDLLNQSGISRVVRIIPDPEKDIGFNIMSLFHYSARVTVHTYESYPEAEKYSQLQGYRL